MSLAPGFHALPAAQYHADEIADSPSLSNSVAQVILRESPRKASFIHPRLNPDYREKQEDKFDIGSASHSLFLEGDDCMVVVAADDWRTKVAQEQRAEARRSGKIPVLGYQADKVRAMVKAARDFVAQSEIAEFWNAPDAKSEVTAVWKEGSVWLRARMDRFSHARKFIGDYKSTADASPEPFSRLLVRMGYHIQDAFYRRACRANGIPDPRFVFLVQSTEQPHECSLHGCDPALQQIADYDVERAIGIWRDCMTRKEWPSYDKRIHWAMPSTWMIQEHEMRLLEAA